MHPTCNPVHRACSRVHLQPAALCISRLEMTFTLGKPLPPLQIELYGGLVPKVE